MQLNVVEKLMMNNPVRAAFQRRFEVPRLLRMGGPMDGGRALEVGCGRGVGVESILETFGADDVDAFDLDPKMVELARRRLERYGDHVRLWAGDVTQIEADDQTYDAVFDFGIIHHVPDWRAALHEIARVLKPGGLLYAEEVLLRFLRHRVWKTLLRHPEHDRFDEEAFTAGLQAAGFEVLSTQDLWGHFAWFVARRVDAVASAKTAI